MTLRVAPVELVVLPVKTARDGATSVPLRLRGVDAEARWVGVQLRVRPALGVALRGLTARRGTESAAAGREVIVAPDVDEPGAFFVTIAALNLDPIPDLDGDGELELATLLPELGPGAAGGGAPLVIDKVVLTDNQPVDLQPAGVVAGGE